MEFFNTLSAELFAIVFITALIAGFLTSVASAGSLIILPVLMSIGIPPINAMAITKAQGMVGLASATWSYTKLGYINFQRIRLAIVCSAIGASIGVYLVQQINVEVLELAIPILLILVALYLLISKEDFDQPKSSRLDDKTFNIFAGSGAGFYDGLFGVGIGTFLIGAFRQLRGDSITSALAHAKPIIFSALIAGTLVFAVMGHINWAVVIVMGIGQAIGAYIGAHVAVKNGQRIIKPTILIVTLTLAIKLLIS